MVRLVLQINVVYTSDLHAVSQPSNFGKLGQIVYQNRRNKLVSKKWVPVPALERLRVGFFVAQ